MAEISGNGLNGWRCLEMAGNVFFCIFAMAKIQWIDRDHQAPKNFTDLESPII